MKLITVSTGAKNGNAYILDNGHEALILDAGCKFKDIQSALGYDLMKVQGVLISHVHRDHTKSIKDFVNRGIKCYGCEEVSNRFGTELILERKTYKFGGYTVVPYNLPHTTRDDNGDLVPCQCYGYYIKHDDMGQLIYQTDYEYPPLSFRNQRIEHILSEVNWQEKYLDSQAENFKHKVKGHMSLECFTEKVLEHNHTDALRTVLICHISEKTCNAEEILNEVQNRAGKAVKCVVVNKGTEVEL